MLRTFTQEEGILNKDILNKKNIYKSWWATILFWLAFSMVFVLLFRPITIYGESMYPTFTTGDYILIRTDFLNELAIERGDIVVFESTLMDKKKQHKMLIKRVIGLPGDNVRIKEGITYVNHKVYDEFYTYGDVDVIVPEGHYFVLGDNRNVSIDSRSGQIGFVEDSTIKGEVSLRVFPFWRFGLIE